MFKEKMHKVNYSRKMETESLDFAFMKKWARWQIRKPVLLYVPIFVLTVLFINSSSSWAVIYISNIVDLQKIGKDPSYPLSGQYELTQDIDASNTINWYSGAGFTPIGDGNNPFTGKFDGKGYKVTELYINRPERAHVGLFACIVLSGEVKNLGIKDCWIKGNSHSSALVGYIYYGTVRNCYSTGSVFGNGYVGGLVGENGGSVVSCYSTCSVYGNESVGGLVGDNYDGSVSNCYSTGTVYVNGNYAGGLVGYNSWGTISNSYSTGMVSGSGVIGGFVGIGIYGTVSSCYWDTETSGQNSSDGGTGKTTAEMKQQSTFSGWDFTNIWGIVENTTYPYLLWRYVVPNVTGMSQSAAESAINEAGLTVGTVTQQYSDTIPAGTVISQSPLSGVQVPPGSSVDLTVTTGLFPIQIDSIEKLQKIGNDSNYPLNREYELTQDIDASNTISWNSGAGFSPIGTMSKPFTGKLDGKGYKITGLYINRSGTDKVGLFGYIGTNGELKDIQIKDCQVTGNNGVGGLVGHNLGTLSNCYSTGSVSGNNSVGGLIGINENATISNIHSNCTVSGKYSVGGLVGNNSGTVNKSYSTGTVSATNNYIGGLVGNNSGTVSNCYSTGTVSSSGNQVGGLVGYNYYSTISNCYSTGSVSGNIGIGGLVGYSNNGTVSYCYSTGSVSGNSDVGGLVGYRDSGSVSNCYWDTQTSGQSSSAGGTGKTTAQMKQQATYVGWEFLNTWGIIENTIYPRFLWQFVVPEITGMTQSAAESALTEAGFTLGTVTVSEQCSDTIPEGNVFSSSPLSGVQLPPGSSVDLVLSKGPCPIKIDTIEELQKIGNDPGYPLNRDYELTQNIDASDTMNWNSGAGFAPIGTDSNPFTGIFDGQGYKITGLYINRSGTDYVGLFGYISGEINNLGINNCQISGKDYVGSLAGCNLGTISNCYSTGSVSGDNYVGGLVGNNGAIATISKCYTNCTVSGSGYLVGGLVGNNYGSVSNCYSIGSVSGNSDFVGGLLGYNYYGATSYCYSAGVVSGSGGNVGGLIGKKEGGSVSNCYWDVETSGQSTSDGGEGKTTAEMKQQATYIGWDFVDRWDIIETCSYPWLKEITNPYLVQVPSVVGSTPASAEALLFGMGLRLGEVTQQCSDITPVGRIISQSPSSGIYLLPCGMVDIVVSTGPCSEGEGVVEGTSEGEGIVEGEGTTEGEGIIEGTPEGSLEGEGVLEGTLEGTTEGEGVVEGEGVTEGTPEGEGINEGTQEGTPEGEGTIEGTPEGTADGEGITEGTPDGTPEGIVEGTPEGTPEGEGTLEGEGVVEGTPEGEGTVEGSTEGEGEGGVLPPHSADQDGDGLISLSELLRVIQFFNFGAYHCDAQGEDGYAPGPGDQSCQPHASDYNPSDWNISLSELLRVIQFFNSGGYHPCPDNPESEDGYCPGP